jgi:hypothetical protein
MKLILIFFNDKKLFQMKCFKWHFHTIDVGNEGEGWTRSPHENDFVSKLILKWLIFVKMQCLAGKLVQFSFLGKKITYKLQNQIELHSNFSVHLGTYFSSHNFSWIKNHSRVLSKVLQIDFFIHFRVFLKNINGNEWWMEST